MGLIRSIIQTATFRQSSITFGGIFINGLLGIVFFITIARFLGPSDFGIFSVSIAVLTLIADIADLGTDTGLVKFVSKYYKKDPSKAYKFLKFSLEIKLVVSLVAVSVGIIAAPLIAQSLFSKGNQLTLPLRIAFVGVASALLFSYLTHALQAFQKFWAWSLVHIGTNALRLLIVFVFVFFGALNLGNALVIYLAFPFIGFLVGLYILPIEKIMAAKKESSIAKQFFHYNKWVALFTLVAATAGRLDTFVTARLLTAQDVGIYAAAQQLTQVVPQVVTALGTVVAPKFAGMSNDKSFKDYFGKVQVFVTVIALMGLIGIPVGHILIPMLYGQAYQQSVLVFSVLLIGMLFNIVAIPTNNAILYYHSNPRFFVWLSFVNIFIVGFVSWQLIGIFGVFGAAIAVLIASLVNFIIPAIWLFYRVSIRS